MQLPILLSCILTLISQILVAQENQEIKYGKVSLQELEMKFYEGDSTAEAVILSDIGEYDDGKFYRHLRVKILKKSGTTWGNWVFNVPSKGHIDGLVFKLEDGEIIEEKLKNTAIYEEETVNGFVLYKVFMPNVRVGSIIDIRFFFYGVPFEWRFQERVPIAYSELNLGRTEYLSISSVGFIPVEVIEHGSHWKVHDMPAFRSEPYMNHYSNYITKFQIEYTGLPYQITWNRIAELLEEYQFIGGVLRMSGFLNGFAKDIQELDLSLDEKIDTAYSYIQQNIKWNNVYSFIASDMYRSHFLKDHSGNAAEINLLLTSLLNKMDIDAVPVILSTRDNGMLNPITPTINKLNYIVCYVREDDKGIFLDATDDDLRPGYLPIRCINGKGRFFEKDNTGWVDLDPHSKYHSQSMITIHQDASNFTATLDRLVSDYAYLDWKKAFDKHGSEANYISSFESNYPGLFIQSYSNEISKSALKVTEKISLDMNEFVDDLGKEIYIPVNFLLSVENPFSNSDRKYPVDLIVPRSDFQMVTLEVDESYQIAYVPPPLRIKLPDDEGEFVFISNTLGNTIQIQCKFNIDQTLFTSDKYSSLQNFYMQMIGKLNESIQIVKKT